MRFYQTQHPFYCGIDLHAKSLYVCILAHDGEILVHQKIPARPDTFLRLIRPYREGLVVGVECMFAWYWLADLCEEHDIEFVLGRAAGGTAGSSSSVVRATLRHCWASQQWHPRVPVWLLLHFPP